MTGTLVAPPGDVEAPQRVSRLDRSRPWYRLILASAASVTLLDGALLQRKYGLFTGGFLASHQFGTMADSAAFMLVALLLNATIAAPLTLAALFAGRWLRLRPRAAAFAAVCVAVLPLVVADFVNYQIWLYLGDAFDLDVMFALTGRRVSEVFVVIAPLMSRPLFVLALGLAGIAIVTALLQRFDDRRADAVVLPKPASALRRCLALTALSALAATGVSLTSDSLSYGLRATPSGRFVVAGLNRVSDVDLDGFGSLRNPRDTAAFDARVRPYALEIPGNGVDDNGVGGDLRSDLAAYRELPPPADVWPDRPPVILFVLESFRPDAVGASYGGRPVTPILDGLSREGLRVDSAWSHNGFTAQSRFHILSGSVSGGRRNTTILDDFKNRGYEVGYFSAQDDTFGDISLDYGQVDRYYDARQDLNRRYTTYTTPGSLAVPMTVVEQRIAEYLDGRHGKQPLFLYVNFHDTHYPYAHDGLENLLGVDILTPSRISPGRRLELHRTYLNTVANVDRAIGRVITAVERNAGRRPAIVVIGDHGESLFEGGFLGHGHALDERQTRIPLIVSGLAMKVRLPFGQADLRDALSSALARRPDALERAVAEWPRNSRVFQYLGILPAPRQIGWRTAGGSFIYDFRSDRVELWGSMVERRALIGEPKRLFEELIHTWEGMQLALSASASRHQ